VKQKNLAHSREQKPTIREASTDEEHDLYHKKNIVR